MAFVGEHHSNDKSGAIRLQCQVLQLANGVVRRQEDVVLHALQQGLQASTDADTCTRPCALLSTSTDAKTSTSSTNTYTAGAITCAGTCAGARSHYIKL